MKINPFRSIIVTLSFLYVILALINMAFFTLMIYENQIDLIAENARLRITETASNLSSAIETCTLDISSSNAVGEKKPAKDPVNSIASLIEKNTSSFIIYKEDGTVVYIKNLAAPDESDIRNSLRAITNHDISGKKFHTTLDEKNRTITLYIPFKLNPDNYILMMRQNIADINSRLMELYRLIFLIIIAIALFHSLMAIPLYYAFVRPVRELYHHSMAMSAGNLKSRSRIRRKDEIGKLAQAFNTMADTLSEKIMTLEDQRNQMKFELAIAGEVQKVIFPRMTDNETLSYSLFHHSFSGVSGDYYDIFPLPGSSFGCLLLDVSGHGVSAALMTMTAKEIFKRNALIYSDPAELLQNVNSEIVNLLSAHGNNPGIYLSAFYCVITKDGTLTYCNGGHVKPVLMRTSENNIEALSSDGFLLGITKDMNGRFESRKTSIRSGDKIVLFTDGIVEARNSSGQEYGSDKMDDLIRSIIKLPGREIKNMIMDAITEHLNGSRFNDDATLLIVEIK